MGLQWSLDHFVFTAKKSGTVNDVYFLGPLVLFFAPAPPFLLLPRRSGRLRLRDLLRRDVSCYRLNRIPPRYVSAYAPP